jgi:hypothetical protein
LRRYFTALFPIFWRSGDEREETGGKDDVELAAVKDEQEEHMRMMELSSMMARMKGERNGNWSYSTIHLFTSFGRSLGT